MRKILIALLLLLASTLAFGQGVLYSDSVYSSAYVYGKQVSIAIPGAKMTVCANPAVMQHGVCTNRIPLFSDMGLQTMTPNPVTLDSNSNYHFYLPQGVLAQYTITLNGQGYGPYNFPVGGTPTSSGGGTIVGRAPYAQSFANVTSVTLLGTSHLYTTTSLLTTCYDNESPALQIQPAQVYVNTATYDVTVVFATPQSGFCVVNGGVGPQGVSNVPGPAGPANSLAIGTVTSGSAAATITGAAPNQTLNLVLPPGPAGTSIPPTPNTLGGVYMPVACPPVADPLNGMSVPQHVSGINYSTGQLLCTPDNNWDITLQANGTTFAQGVRTINFVGSAGMQITGSYNQATGAVTYNVTGSTATQAQVPTFTPAAGAYSGAQSVVLACASPSPTIYYTTNGTTPTTSSNVYASPVSMSSGTLEAMCASAGLNNSNVVSAVYSQTAPTASLSASTLSFGSVTAGTASAGYTVGLSNTGTAALTISAISISGANAGDFSQTNTCGSSLAVNASCTISVVFTPSTVGAESATLNIADNAVGSPQTVALSGTGLTPPPVPGSATWSPSTAAGYGWTNPNGILGTSSYASVVTSLSSPTMMGSGNIPTIPSNATITGFSFTFTAYASSPNTNLQVTAGNGTWLNVSLTTTPSSYTVGGSTNMWGDTGNSAITVGTFEQYGPQQIFNPGYLDTNGVTIYVQHLSSTVYYTTPGAL